MENRININNYEAFLLDYMEGNLSVQDISLLKEFVLLHSELEIDLEDTELVTLEAENISLSSKQNLKKTTVSPTAVGRISDEQFIAYVENTLSREEKEKLELACSADATLAKELRLFKSTILKTDNSITFENKQNLKKQNKVIFFNARVYVSAAAALLLILGLWFTLRNIGNDVEIKNNLSENKNPVNTNSTAVVNSSTINNNPTPQNTNVTESPLPSKNNVANNIKTPVINSYTTPLIVSNNNIDTLTKIKEDKIAVIKKDSVTNESIPTKQVEKIATNNPLTTKKNYIITEGSDDDVAVNTNVSEKTGFWNKASKALKNLNKLGVKKVDAKETVATNNEQTVLSLGNFKIEKNRYN